MRKKDHRYIGTKGGGEKKGSKVKGKNRKKRGRRETEEMRKSKLQLM